MIGSIVVVLGLVLFCYTKVLFGNNSDDSSEQE